MSSASSQSQSPASQELNLWNRILSELKNISKSKEQTDTLTGKVNKVHGKLQGFAENQKTFSQNAAVKLRELYISTSDALEKESRYLQDVLQNIQILIEIQEENDQVLRKRKAEEQRGNIAKKSKEEDPFQLYIGTQVAANVNSNWILAVVVNGNEIKGKIEIEDIEEDDDNPGLKRRYHVLTKYIIPIVKTMSKKEFAPGSDVLALFPASSCFYTAKVIVPPAANRARPGMYLVKFEDDEDFEREVSPSMILALPTDS